MSRISEVTLIKSIDWRRESFSLEHLGSELLEQLMEDPLGPRDAGQKAKRLKLVLRGRRDLSHNSEIALFVNSGKKREHLTLLGSRQVQHTTYVLHS